MPENRRYLNLKSIGIGIFVLLLFVLILIALKPSAALNADVKNGKSDHKAAVLNQSEAELLAEQVSADLSVTDLPQYTGEAFVILNEDIPLFTEKEITSITGVTYSDLDELGRCGPAYGLIGPETIPEAERGPIGDVKPSGWHTVRYDDLIEDRYLYNRCHLIAYQLAGANAEERNLITGTRYLNIIGMLPIENMIWGYVQETGNHVLYRVTPVFEEDNLVASGIIMEAYSVEDSGKGIQLCRYVFNVQPGVTIDYETGDSSRAVESYTLDLLEPDNDSDSVPINRQMPITENSGDVTYVLNINTMRFHDPTCPSVEDMSDKNRRYSCETREELIELGYKPCDRCRP